MHMHRWLLIAGCAVVFLQLQAFAQPLTDVTVYVFTKTDPSGFSDPFQVQRLQSLAHLKTALDKKKTIAVVDQADGADLTIEVLEAGKLETGNQRTQGLGYMGGLDGALMGTTTRKETKPQVHVVLRAGAYQIEFNGTSRQMSNAAKAVADGIETWVKQNSGKLGGQNEN